MNLYILYIHKRTQQVLIIFSIRISSFMHTIMYIIKAFVFMCIVKIYVTGFMETVPNHTLEVTR